jgi:hypothetical protein
MTMGSMGMEVSIVMVMITSTNTSISTNQQSAHSQKPVQTINPPNCDARNQ